VCGTTIEALHREDEADGCSVPGPWKLVLLRVGYRRAMGEGSAVAASSAPVAPIMFRVAREDAGSCG